MKLIAYPLDDEIVMDILIDWVTNKEGELPELDTDLSEEEIEHFTIKSNNLLELMISLGGYYGELFYLFSTLLMNENAVTMIAYKSIRHTYVLSSDAPPIFVCILPIDKYAEDFGIETLNEMVMDLASVAIPTMLALQLNTDRMESGRSPLTIQQFNNSLSFASFKNEVLQEFINIATERIPNFYLCGRYSNIAN
jgi:hypothetical protein